MDVHIEKLYRVAPRFDEGVTALLEEYTAALYEEMECEAKHYFQEGYRAAQKEGKT